jgi:hypothetical protein
MKLFNLLQIIYTLNIIILSCSCSLSNKIKINSQNNGASYNSGYNSYSHGNNYGGNNVNSNNNNIPTYNAPQLFREPSIFSFPPSMISSESNLNQYERDYFNLLNQQCYSVKLNEYIYSLCPFHNMTQKGVSSALHVNMGVWDKWKLSSTFEFIQFYSDGNTCSSGKKRSTTIVFKCLGINDILTAGVNVPAIDTQQLDADQIEQQLNHGLSLQQEFYERNLYGQSYIHSVTEPKTCEYNLHFHTPIVCNIYARAKLHYDNLHKEMNYTKNEKDKDITLDILSSMRECINLMSEESSSPATYNPICGRFLKENNLGSRDEQSNSIQQQEEISRTEPMADKATLNSAENDEGSAAKSGKSNNAAPATITEIVIARAADGDDL